MQLPAQQGFNESIPFFRLADLPLEGNAVLIQCNEAAVGDRDPVVGLILSPLPNPLPVGECVGQQWSAGPCGVWQAAPALILRCLEGFGMQYPGRENQVQSNPDSQSSRLTRFGIL